MLTEGRALLDYARAAAEKGAVGNDPMDVLERQWTATALESRTSSCGGGPARSSARRSAMGLPGPGMTRPAWSPGCIAGDDEPGGLEFMP